MRRRPPIVWPLMSPASAHPDGLSHWEWAEILIGTAAALAVFVRSKTEPGEEGPRDTTPADEDGRAPRRR